MTNTQKKIKKHSKKHSKILLKKTKKQSDIDIIEKYSNKYFKKNLNKNNKTLENIIFNNQYKHLFFYGDMSLEEIKPIIDELLSFSINDKDQNNKKQLKGIVLHIHCGGGDTNAGLTLYNICKNVNYPLFLYTEGQSGSASTYLSFWFKDFRIIAPYSTTFIHQMNDNEKGQSDELYFKHDILEKMNEMFCKNYSKYSYLSENEIKEIITYDFFMSSKECLNLGLIDMILPINNKNKKNNNKTYENDKHLFVLSASQWKEYSDSKEIITQIYDCIFNNINPIIHISDFNQGLDGVKEITMVLPLINLCSTSPIKITAIINAPINESSVLFTICCSYRKMSKNSMFIINFTNIIGEDWQPKMQSRIKYYKTYSKIISDIFNKFSQLPRNILDNIMTKRFLLSPDECLKYKLVDELF